MMESDKRPRKKLEGNVVHQKNKNDENNYHGLKRRQTKKQWKWPDMKDPH